MFLLERLTSRSSRSLARSIGWGGVGGMRADRCPARMPVRSVLHLGRAASPSRAASAHSCMIAPQFPSRSFSFPVFTTPRVLLSAPPVPQAHFD